MCVENFTLYFTSQGLDETALTDRKRTVFKVMQNLIDQMLTEENGKLVIISSKEKYLYFVFEGMKKKLVDDSEAHLKLCDKLSAEMGVR